MTVKFLPKNSDEKETAKVYFQEFGHANVFESLVNKNKFFVVAKAKGIEVVVSLNPCYSLADTKAELERLYEQAINSNPSDYEEETSE